MNIAIVYATFYTYGGAENMIIRLADELLRRGHQIAIFTSEYDHADTVMPDSVRQRMIEISAGGNYSTWIDWMWAGWRLRKTLQGFDLVNPHNFPANVWVYYAKQFSPTFPRTVWYCQEPSRLLYDQNSPVQTGHYSSLTTHLWRKARQDGLKFLWKLLQKSLFYVSQNLFGSYLHQWHIRLDQRAVRDCDLALANSRYTASKIQALYGIAATVCYQGISAIPRTPLPAREKPGYFLTVSRLERLKHIDTIIRALDIVVHRHQQRDVSLMIVGTGTEEAALRAQVAQLELQQHVIFPGFVSDADVHRLYSEALAVVFVPEDEPFGLVPLEAMIHATPVIVSNSGGTVETVQDQETGLYVEQGNAEQLAEAMLFLAQHPEQAQQMGERGYAYVMQHWTVKHFVDRFEQLVIQ